MSDRIRDAVDLADPADAKEMIELALSANLPTVPVHVARAYCDGAEFVKKYLRFVEVEEVDNEFQLNPQQLRTVGAMIRLGQNEKQIRKLSQKFRRPKNSEGRYTKDGVTICKIKSKGRFGIMWYLRIQRDQKREMIDLDRSRSLAFSMAKNIRRKVKAGLPLLEVLRQEAPQSNFLNDLEVREKSAESKMPREVSQNPVCEPGATLMQVVKAYEEGAKNPTNGLNPKNARRCVNQLRKVIALGLQLKLPKDKTKKEVQAAEKRAFDRPVSDLTPEVVDTYMDKMLGVGTDYEDIDEIEILERSESANSTFRQAKSIFSGKGQKIFRRAGLVFDLPRDFLAEGFMPVAHGRYTLPEFHRIEGIFEEMLTLRKSDPQHYLARLIGLYVNLRPKEIIHMGKDQIQYSGYWRVEIRVRADFKPKHYHERSIKISAGLAEHILDVCRDNGTNYVIASENRPELFRPFNAHLRDKFLPDTNRPSYELRKFYASASKLAVGLGTTHERMGHIDDSTTKKHYIDKDTPQELVDLFEKYAQKLFGDAAFLK